MRCMGLLLLSFLVGCAPVTTLEELEAQAYVSGDWSAVRSASSTFVLRTVKYTTMLPLDA